MFVLRALLLLLVGCVSPHLANPVLLTERGDAPTLGLDGRYLWITSDDMGLALVAGGPGVESEVLDHGSFGRESGPAFVIAGPDAIVWGRRASFDCGGIRVVDANGGRILPTSDLCDTLAVDQFRGMVSVAHEDPSDGVDIDQISLATGARSPWLRIAGGVVESRVLDDQLYLTVTGYSGTYITRGRRDLVGGTLPFEFSVADFGGYAVDDHGLVILDRGRGDAPAQLLVPNNDRGILVADLGLISPQGLYAANGALWTVLDDNVIGVTDQATSYATAFREMPVAMVGDQLVVRDLSNYPDDYDAFYLQPLVPATD